ncbi:MAG: DNA polymerase III subunit delta [Clostridia bacterium]|nr:DNA polymerase III subunit delta [Clostridia bacterium]
MELIKEDVFRKQIKKSLSGGYLFFGEEDYLKAVALRSAREAICPDETFALFNDVRIDALDYSPAALLDAMMPPPMMADQKIITVSGLPLASMRASEIEDLLEVLSLLSQYDYNVVIISVPAGQMDEGFLPKSPSKTVKEFSKFVTPVWFESISKARLVAWVGKHFEHHGVSASPAVCEKLISICGQSMFILSSETEKLAYYALSHGKSEVTEREVEEIAIAEISSDTFALTNALLDGHIEDALRALEVMKFRRVEPVFVLGEISRSIGDLLAIKLLTADGATIPEMMSILGIRSEYKVKLYASAAAGKSERRLRQTLDLCSQADLALKQSAKGYLPIERLICGLSF